MSHAGGRQWKTFNPTLTIPSTKNVSYQDDIYTVYQIHIADGPDEYTVSKRFAAFQDLHGALRVTFTGLPPFAESSFFENKFQPAIIERRRRQLEEYMQRILSVREYRESRAVKMFLIPFEAIGRPRYTNRPAQVSAPVQQNVVEGRFIMPPMPSNLYLEDHFQFANGKVFQLSQVLQQGCDALSFLNVVDTQLSEIPESNSEARCHYFLSNPQSFENVALTLQIQMGALEEVLAEGAASLRPEASFHLASCLSVMEQASKFSSELLSEIDVAKIMQQYPDGEDSTVPVAEDHPKKSSISLDKGDIGDSPLLKDSPDIVTKKESPTPLDLSKKESPLPAIDLHKDDMEPWKDTNYADPEPIQDAEYWEKLSFTTESMVANMHEQVDDLLIRATQCTSKEQAREIVSQLQQMANKARAHLEQLEEQQATEILMMQPPMRALRNLLHETMEQSKTIQPDRFESTVQVNTGNNAIGQLEGEIFQVVQMVHDADPNDRSAGMNLKSSLKDLNKRLADLRHHLGQSNTNNDQARLEDLQENLSDLKHEFKSVADKKFKGLDQMKDLAYQAVIDRQVKAATQQHRALEDDMFGL